MSSHPQSVPTTRRTVETRHLPNPATLPLQLQRAHTVRKLAWPTTGLLLLLRWNPLSSSIGFVALALSAWWIFRKQGITLNPWRAWPQGPRWSFSNTQVTVLCTQSRSLIRCLSWKFMLSLYSPIKISPIISTIVYVLWTKLSVFQKGGR